MNLLELLVNAGSGAVDRPYRHHTAQGTDMSKGTKGTKEGGSPVGKMSWPLPHDKTKDMSSTMGKVKSIAAGSNEDHEGGLPKGKLRKG